MREDSRLPEPQHGGAACSLALQWLRRNGIEHVWLSTGPDTTAARFYERRGWIATGRNSTGDIRYELRRQGSPD